MAVGAVVRRAFGPYEREISDAWRAMFVDLDAWTRAIKAAKPDPGRILEVGCGEGAGTEKLAEYFPNARIDAIDIADNLGRLYRGDTDRVVFRKQFVEDRAAAEPGAYDLVVLCDVIHHVPQEAQDSLLVAIRTLLRPGGVFAMKDWHRDYTPVYWTCYLADRYLTGDRIRYKKPGEARAQLDRIFGSANVERSAPIRPWRNNYTFFASVD
ncbi:MAG: class I SAM-dependent methyltransferase [Erythrobacter sp.]